MVLPFKINLQLLSGNCFKAICLLLFLHISLATTYAQSISERLDAVVQSYVANGEFNGSVLVAKKGEVLLQKGYGYADLESRIKNRPDTKFLIGSTTKSFTAVAVMQFVENGLLSLHEPISVYLPFLKPEIGKMTLHQLLKMTSGLQGHLGRVTTLKYQDISARDMAGLINQSPVSFEPGSDFEYSNLNYQLAACILAEVSQMTYGQVLEKYTFGPLGMTDSGAETTSLVPDHKAKGYDVNDEKQLTKSARNYMSYALGSGDVYSTVEDMFKWDRALHGGGYLSEESRRLLFDGTPGVYDGYGYGFKVREYGRQDGNGSGKLVRHGGSMRGYFANFHRYLDDDIAVIILGNIRPFPIGDMTFDLKEVAIGGNPGRENKSYRY